MCCCVLIWSSLPKLDLYGNAGWADGVSTEDNDFIAPELDPSLSVFAKAFFFGLILSAVALGIKISKRRQANATYEKVSNIA